MSDNAGLLGGSQWLVNELRLWRVQKRLTENWFVLLLVVGCSGGGDSTPVRTTSTAPKQLWSNSLTPSRATDWQNNQVGVVGSIPIRTTICATLTPGASAMDITNAINSCPDEGVVFLNAGTFSLSSGIVFGKNNVTLRGAGPDQTFLVFSAGDPCNGLGGDICMAQRNWGVNPPANLVKWTAGYTQGTTQITLSSVAASPNNALTVGSLLFLDQLDDQTQAPTLPPDGIFVSSDCSWQNSGCEGDGRVISGQQNINAQIEVQTVTAIDAVNNIVTISPGLRMPNWSGSRNPTAWWQFALTSGSRNGIENLSLDHTGSGTTVASGILMFYAANSWVKNVRSIKSNRNHVWMAFCQHCETRDSYFFDTQNHFDLSYGVESVVCSDCLVENNIFQQVTAPNLSGQSIGSVYGYNYHINMPFPSGINFMLNGDNGSHHAATAMNLHEGNMTNGHSSDITHGTSNLQTLFRNRYIGMDTQPWESGQPQASWSTTYAMSLLGYHRYYNVIGNVLGLAGYHTQYEMSDGPEGGPNNAVNQPLFVYHLVFTGTTNSYDCGAACAGYAGGALGRASSPFSAYQYDANMINTLYRWGNYDVVNAAGGFGSPLGVNWNNITGLTSEVPSDQFTPANHTLPASCYRSSKPSWFGNVPWPPIGPEVTDGNDTGLFADTSGHTNMIPAKVCYRTVMNGPPDGTGGPLTFNASACY